MRALHNVLLSSIPEFYDTLLARLLSVQVRQQNVPMRHNRPQKEGGSPSVSNSRSPLQRGRIALDINQGLCYACKTELLTTGIL